MKRGLGAAKGYLAMGYYCCHGSPRCVVKGVSVEAVDPVFQTKMLDMLKQTGRYALVLCRILPAALLAAFLPAPTRVFNSFCTGASQPPLRLPAVPNPYVTCCADPRWWWAGTTPTRALAAGSPASTSTRSRFVPCHGLSPLS